ncbi:MAG TPA: transglutaminase domain-containing protein [Burkholderiales bacterium]|nr:transglutaminase domain-containing protein [Burkholderiales bacterium]
MPPFVLGAALVFWGWQTHNLLVGALLGALAEAPRFISYRLELSEADYRRVGDFCTALFAAAGALLVATRGLPRGVVATLQWLPALLAPLVLAQRFGATGTVRLSALFYTVRRRKARDPGFADPAVDLSGAYLAAAVIAAGGANWRGPGYYAGVIALAGWTLYVLRPRRAARAGWALAFALAAALGYAGHVALARLQAHLETLAADWALRAPVDPYRNHTDIGAIGRLKLEDAILMRVRVPAGQEARARLLHAASYNSYAGGTWSARAAPLAPLRSEPDGATWVLAPGAPGASLVIDARATDGRLLLALPAGTLSVAGLPADALRANGLGAVLADAQGDWVRYVARYGADAGADEAPPTPLDLALPAEEEPALARVAAQIGLRGLSRAEAARRVAAYLAGFRYSTYRAHAPRAGMTALGDFLLVSHSGHCEYFAAATTLLLRAAGVPARYAVGYAAREYSPLEGAVLVRARHAHAWTRAFIGGRWVDLDNTPPVWFEAEAAQAPAWEGMEDFLRWALYRWQRREPGEASGLWWWGLAALVAALGLRFAARRGALRRTAFAVAPPARRHPGMDSEFYAVERVLARRAGPRAAHESLAAWALRASAGLDDATRAELAAALALHQRHRFDPAGLSPAERRALRERSLALAGALAGARLESVR